MNRDSLRKTLVLLISFTALTCVAVGVRSAIHSPLFMVQVVEVGDQPESAPVDPQTISELAAVQLGKVNLFELDLKAVEHRLLAHPWIRQVTLIKRFPSTLSISVIYREPRALLQNPLGTLSYVDVDGRIFGHVNVLARSDLPMVSGLAATDRDRIHQALSLLERWDESPLRGLAQISSLNWDDERGFRAWIVYSITGASGDAHSRTVVDLGQDLDLAAIQTQFRRLGNVILYLSQHSVAVNQIWADSGKKIVVRTSHGS